MMELCGETRGVLKKIKDLLSKKLPDTVFLRFVLINIILKLSDELNGAQELVTYLEQMKRIKKVSYL